MADKKLNELDQIRAPDLAALLYLVQGGVDHRIERQHLLALPGYVEGSAWSTSTITQSLSCRAGLQPLPATS